MSETTGAGTGGTATAPAASKGAKAPAGSPMEENKYHNYVTNAIPWYVHLLWLIFWVCSIAYLIYFMFPTMKQELITPP